MKQTSKITLCAICSALSATVMVLGYFPYFTYAVPALAGLFTIIPLVEIGISYAFATYIVSSVLVLLIAEPETKVLFVVFLGFYPILKSLIEKIGNSVLEWIIKMLSFNIAVTAVYFILKLLTDIDVDDFGLLGKWGAIVFVILCNIAFVLYDIAIKRVCMLYIYKVKPKLEFFLK